MNDARPPRAEVSLTVDVVVLTLENDKLIRRADEPFVGQLALPGGFLWRDETAREAAARVLATKAGVEDPFIDQLYTFDAQGRDPRARVVSVAHYALVREGGLVIRESADTQNPELVDVVEANGLAFDHDRILTVALSRLRSKLGYTNVARELLPTDFTLTKLQNLYETVLGRPLDKRNFRKKYLSLGLIEPTGSMTEGARHRPAQLYRFMGTATYELTESFF
jgi:8-oxo-dGTP diphosphatase